ncbi:MAG: PAS domain S-box protein [Candidatus Thorarchaeota archaeon]
MSSTVNDIHTINQLVFENIEDLILICNEKLECEYISINEAIRGTLLNEFLHPSDSNKVLKFIEKVFKEGFAIEQTRIKMGSTPYKWYEIKGKRFVGDDNNNKIFLICRDVTKLKNCEQELQQTQIRFNQLADTLPEIKYWKLLQSKEGMTAIQKTREMLEVVINNIPQLIYWKDRNLTYLGCNANFAVINGLDNPHAIHGRSDKELKWVSKNLDYIREQEFKVMSNDSPEYNLIELYELSNRNQVWYEVNRIPLHDLRGKVVGILSTYEDITLRKISEQKLRKSEEKYRGILENIKEAYFEVDLEGNFTFFNDAFIKLLGTQKDKLFGLSYENFVDDENRKKMFDVYNQVFRTERSETDFQFQFRNQQGELRTCESSVYLRHNIKGEKIGFNGLARDITEKHILEQKIKESEEKYRTIFNSSPDYIFMTDIEGNILEMNLALLERIDMTIEEVLGINFSQFYAGDNLEELLIIQDEIRSGKEIRGFEIKAKAKSGEIFEYEINSVPLKENGKVVKVLNLARDVTDKKTAEQKLRQSEKKYRHLFNSSPYVIWLMEEDGTIVDCNSTTSELLSVLKIEEIIGKKFSEVLSVLERPNYLINVLQARFDKFLKGEKLGPLELQITRGDRKKLWLSVQTSLVKVGKKILTQAIIQDISNLKDSEEKLRTLNKKLEVKIFERTRELRESEEKYRHLYEYSPNGIVLLNSEGTIIDINSTVPQMFGYNKQDLIGKNYLSLMGIYPSDTKIALRDMTELLSQRTDEDSKVVPRITAIYNKDGTRSWVHSELSTMEIGNETIIQLNIQDITDKKVAEEKLKESEQQYRTTINSIGDALHVVDKDLNIILANTQLFNWLNELQINTDIINRNLTQVFPFLPQTIFEEYKQVFDTGKTLVTIETTTLPELNVVTETRKIPIFSEGEVNQVITILRDITESKEMENQLRESEEKYRNMVDNLDVGFYKGEYQGKLLMHNQALTRIMGLNPNDNIIGIESSQFFKNPETREKYYEELKKKGYVRNFLAQVQKRDGEIITVDLNAHVLYNSEGLPVETEGTVADITEKFKLQQELQESEKKLREQNIELMKLDEIKNDFITMAAHELKTPLISISGYTDYILMKHRSQLSPEITEDLKTVQRNVSRLEVLMDQLLDVMKIDENKLKLQKELVNVTKIINNCLDELSYLINEKNLEVILNINHEIMLNVDPNRMFTVFTNLISNAIKFTPDYGWVEISGNKVKDNYIFEVKDNGIGLAEDELPRLFMKFERIRQTNHSTNLAIKDSGTGLGLYITKGIVNAHNGEIHAKSDGLEKGATFFFTIPIK